MSKAKGKAVKPSIKENLSWEHSLQTEEVDEEKWKACVILATPATIDDDFAIQLLVHGIKSGNRKLVKAITREELLQQIREGGKIAGKKLQGRESAWLGAYEVAKQYLDINEEIPLALWARIIKAKILAIKDEDKNRREAEKKFLESRIKKPGEPEKGGRKSATGKKPAKKAAGEATVDDRAPKVESKLVKRGEEDFVAKYADDEPEDGPQHYICVAGFRDAYLPAVLISAGVRPWGVVRISAEDYNVYGGLAPLLGPQSQPPPDAIEAFEKQKQLTLVQLVDFWRDVGLVLSQPNDASELHNIPILEFTYKLAHFVPHAELLASVTASPEEKLAATTTFCDDFSTMMYDLVDWRRQYQTWLTHSRIVNIPQLAAPPSLDDYGNPAVSVPTSPGGTHIPEPSPIEIMHSVDMRYYTTVLDSVPDELCTVPLIMHCMLDQVSATVEGRSPPDPNPARPDGLPSNVVEIFNNMISKSSLSTADVQMLKSELQLMPQYNNDQLSNRLTAPELYAYNDDRALRQRSISGGNGQNTNNQQPQPVRMPLVNIAEAERTILKYSPLALAIAALPEASSCSGRRKAALQNMIASLSASTGLTPLELGYAMKLLMLESLTLPGVDEDGFISYHSPETVLPWDDPFPFFRGMITDEELQEIKDEWKQKLALQLEAEREEEARRASLQQTPTQPEQKPPPPEPKSPTRKGRKGSVKGKEKSPSPPSRSKSPGSAGSRSRSPKHRKSQSPPVEQSRQVESANSKRGIMLRSGSGLRRSAFVHFERDQSGRPIRSRQRFDDLEVRTVDRPIDESIADIRRSLRRKLTEYCFVEFFAPDALMQVLLDCYYERPLLSAYRCRQDNSLLLAFSNPRNHKMFYCEDWASRVYTNVGFRKYLLYVAPNIGEWLVNQESSYMARLLAQDLDEDVNKPSQGTVSGKGKEKRNRSNSPNKKGKKGSEDKTPAEDKNYVPYITPEFQYQNSLKAHKAEEDEAKKAEEAKLAGGKKARSKSPSKKKGVASVTPENPSRQLSAERVAARRSDSAHSIDVEREPHPFVCYDLSNQLMVASGLTATLLPSDGSVIRAERFRFETGRESVRVSCIVDSNVFTVHIISPVMSAAAPQTDEFGSPRTAAPVSHFGSLTAHLANGIVMSVSSFGSDGICTDGAPYAPKVCTPGNLGPPESAATPAPIAAASPTTKKRNRSPKGASPPRTKAAAAPAEPPKETAAPPSEPTANSQPNESAESQRPSSIEQFVLPPNFTKSPLNLTFPNALSIKFYYFTDDAGRSLLTIRQSFEQRRHPMGQSTELSRLITPEGCSIRFLQTGETQVLYPDGAMFTIQPIPGQPATEEVVATEAAAVEVPTERGRSKQSQKPQPNSRQTKTSGPGKEGDDKEVNMAKLPVPPAQIITHISADGWISRYNTAEGRYIEPKRKLPSINRTDAATGQKWTSREDGVEIVIVPSGAAGNPPGVATRCVLFADGTCITSRIETIISELTGDEEDVLTWVRVEAPSFATVTVDRLRWETQLELGSDSATGLGQFAMSCLPDQSFQMFPLGGGRIIVDRDARLLYWPKLSFNASTQRTGQTPDGQQSETNEHLYVLCHNAPTVVQAVDPAGNSFSVSHDGRAAVVSRQQQQQQQQQQQSGKPAPLLRSLSKQKLEEAAGDELHAPRFFVVAPGPNGAPTGGWELKRYRGDIGTAVVAAERDPRCHLTRRAIEDEPRVTSITLLRPFAQLPVEKWTGTRCVVQDLAPPALHPVGWYVPRSTNSINNKASAILSARTSLIGQQPTGTGSLPRIEVRRMFQLTPFTDPLRDVVIEAMRSFVEQVVETNNARRSLAPFDPRSSDEISASESLLMRFSLLGTPRSTEEADARILAELDALGSPEHPGAPARSIKQEQRRVERLQAEEDKRFFRNNCKMSYFKSEFAHRFLRSQAPNLEDLFTAEDVARLSESQGGAAPGSAEKFIVPDEPADQQRPRAATPSQRRKVGADVLVINPFSTVNNVQQTAVSTDSEINAYNITKTPLLLPNVLLVQPGNGVDFGNIVEGQLATRQCWLKNAGQRPVRFSVKEPSPEFGIFLRYEHGPIAPGMKRPITVTIRRNARSVATANNMVEVQIRYDGGRLLLPIRFREVMGASLDPRYSNGGNGFLMSAGSDGDELLTEIYPPRPAAADTSSESVLFSNNESEIIPSPPQQPRPPSSSRRTSPPIVN